MKKILCLLLTVVFVLSMANFTVFAKEAEKVVWTQDFEKKHAGDNAANVEWNWDSYNGTKTGTYADGLRYRYGSSAYAQKGVGRIVDGEFWMAASKNDNAWSRFKVYLDQSIFEDGKTYKILVDLRYVYNGSVANYATKEVRIGAYCGDGLADLTSSNTVGGERKKYTINAGETITAQTCLFTYDGDIYKGDTATQINLVLNYQGFDGTASYGLTADQVYADNVKVVEVNYLDDMIADAGYYAESENGTATSGAISFTAKALYDIENVTEYGIYVYKNGDVYSENFKGSSTTVADLIAEDGNFNVLVNNIPVSEFDTKVVALPYVVIGTTTYFGDVLTYSVNDGGNWLGDK